MIITQVTIHNFRSILHQTFSAFEYTLLVGSNNSGKTAVLDCIRAFYEKEKYSFDEKRDFPMMQTVDEESWIELTYRLDEAEAESLKVEYKQTNNLLKVRKHFKTKQSLEDGRTAKGVTLAYLCNGTLELKAFCSLQEIQKGYLGNVIFIPAANKVEDFAKLTGPSAMRDLIASILTDVLESNPVYEALQTSIEGFGESIKISQTENGKSLAGFEKELDSALAPWDVSFGLKFSTPNATDIVKNMISTKTWDKSLGASQEIENFGSGLQRHFIFSIIRVGNSYISQKPKNTSEFRPSLNLLLFEEPEAFLHPTQQLSLSDDLKKLSKSGGWQVICSTHSPHFVSKSAIDLVSLIHLERQNCITELYQLSTSDVFEITERNNALRKIATKWPNLAKRLLDIEYTQDMDAIKYFMYLNAERAGAFFSNHVLLVEGPSEVALINRLRETGEIDLPPHAYIMDCIGKHNIHRFMNLFGKLGIRHSVVFDDDNDKDEHSDINELIEVDSKNEFTHLVARIPEDLEAFLGVPECKNKDKKPQNILYNLEKGFIDKERIKQFACLIEGAWEPILQMKKEVNSNSDINSTT